MKFDFSAADLHIKLKNIKLQRMWENRYSRASKRGTWEKQFKKLKLKVKFLERNERYGVVYGYFVP